MKESTKIGFIGVGTMGHGLAKNIARAGFPMLFLDHPGNQPAEDLRELGARSTASVVDVGRNGDIIVLCVTGSPQMQEIVLGNDGLLRELTPGKIIVDCSTVEPHVSQSVAAQVETTGASFIDAPLTRTPREAELGMVNVMVGGDSMLLKQIRPLLETFSENIYHAGPTGAGATLKLLHNFISLGNCVLLAEAVVTARRSSVDIETLIDVLTTGGGDSTALKRMSPYIREGDASGLKFSMANGTKDTGYYRSLVSHLGVPSMAADAVHRVFERAMSQGLGDRAVPELIDSLQKKADPALYR
jgi:3-hydroxyisobutyrate dehydrogenase